ncbi:hypothetical protein Vretimale_4044 [Volvox reticuliferus]|uniref:Uncharacterized protein n=1 Tax=Volvox reticuliferus TaxID=1737510 RepID=A0A8J4BWD1_9CHLO|nr:hypothetical protein Vretifemale_1608 [Volvox reticuliferus]GIL98662.1 hypothetical protein Vretimale_4044 [Volvox reticuliferus]
MCCQVTCKKRAHCFAEVASGLQQNFPNLGLAAHLIVNGSNGYEQEILANNPHLGDEEHEVVLRQWTAVAVTGHCNTSEMPASVRGMQKRRLAAKAELEKVVDMWQRKDKKYKNLDFAGPEPGTAMNKGGRELSTGGGAYGSMLQPGNSGLKSSVGSSCTGYVISQPSKHSAYSNQAFGGKPSELHVTHVIKHRYIQQASGQSASSMNTFLPGMAVQSLYKHSGDHVLVKYEHLVSDENCQRKVVVSKVWLPTSFLDPVCDEEDSEDPPPPPPPPSMDIKTGRPQRSSAPLKSQHGVQIKQQEHCTPDHASRKRVMETPAVIDLVSDHEL